MNLKLINKSTEVEAIAELYSIMEERKKIEKREAELKEHFKVLMAGKQVEAMGIGDYLVTLNDRTTSSIDKKRLIEALGEENVKKFINETSYKIFNIKKIA